MIVENSYLKKYSTHDPVPDHVRVDLVEDLEVLIAQVYLPLQLLLAHILKQERLKTGLSIR